MIFCFAVFPDTLKVGLAVYSNCAAVLARYRNHVGNIRDFLYARQIEALSPEAHF